MERLTFGRLMWLAPRATTFLRGRLHYPNPIFKGVLMKQNNVPSSSQREEVNRPSEEQIRVRAHAIYEKRGRQDVHATDDWKQAEA